MTEVPPTAELGPKVVEHSMEVMIDLIADIERHGRLDENAGRALEAYTRILLERTVAYLADDREVGRLLDRLALNKREAFDELDEPDRRIVDAHWKFLADVERLPDGSETTGQFWRRVRRAFNHLVDAFRTHSGHQWRFIKRYSMRMNLDAMAS